MSKTRAKVTAIIMLLGLGHDVAAAPSTKVIHERAFAVYFLYEWRMWLPFAVPRQTLQKRVVSGAKGEDWVWQFDAQSRLVSDGAVNRYEYDHDGGFTHFMDNTLRQRCKVTLRDESQLHYQCDQGNIERIHYDANTGALMLDGYSRIFLSKQKVRARYVVTLDDQFRTTSIGVDKGVADGFNAHKLSGDLKVTHYHYPEDGIVRVRADNKEIIIRHTINEGRRHYHIRDKLYVVEDVPR